MAIVWPLEGKVSAVMKRTEGCGEADESMESDRGTFEISYESLNGEEEDTA